MDNVEKKIIFPDKSTVRYYVDPETGLQTLNMEDVIKVMQGSEENKKILASKMSDFTLNMVTPTPIPKPKEKKIKLSDFNQKLKQAANFNPNKDKNKSPD